MNKNGSKAISLIPVNPYNTSSFQAKKMDGNAVADVWNFSDGYGGADERH